jgi:hypothetical protein
MNDKRQHFLNIWNKKISPMRDSIKAKLECRGIEPSELNCYEYWMGYIKPWADARGNIHHVNPFRNPAFMRSIGRNKYGTPFGMANKNKKKKRKFRKYK